MKKLLIILVLLIPMASVNAQGSSNRKEKRAEREMQKKEEVKKIVNNQSFVFSASQAMPMGGSSINLNYYYNAEVNGDSIQSYLPYYGVAYTADYGSINSPLSFDKSVKDYSMEKDKNGYLIHFDVKNGNDFLNYTFHISELGYASLNVTSTKRQPISFNGIIKPVEGDS